MIIVIVGGGVVGLNCALALSVKRPSDEVFLLEAEDYLGAHASTRNSEVIHAGFTYPPGSLKSEMCIEGNRLTYDLLKKLDVPFKRCGKWIVAFTPEEEAGLNRLLSNAREVRIPGMIEKNASDTASAIPWLKTVWAAVFSETSGIMDASEYIAALGRRLSNLSNVQVLTRCRVEKIDPKQNIVGTTRGEMPFDLLINAAGLFSDELYNMSGGRRNFEIRPFKGEYFTWRKGPIEGLIYPVPERFLGGKDETLTSSMGVHLHRSCAGDRLIGPTQLEMPRHKKTDYRIETPADYFAKEAGRYLKSPPPVSELEPYQAGNRPKLYEDGKPIGDFVLLTEGPFIHLLGIESPGLTAAPALAAAVTSMV